MAMYARSCSSPASKIVTMFWCCSRPAVSASRKNRSRASLQVSQISLPLPNLTLYVDRKNQLWTSDVVLGRSETAKVRYLNVSSDGGKPLTDAQMREIGEAQRSYAALHGTFIVHERQSFEQEWTLEDKDRYERATKIGRVNGFAIGLHGG